MLLVKRIAFFNPGLVQCRWRKLYKWKQEKHLPPHELAATWSALGPQRSNQKLAVDKRRRRSERWADAGRERQVIPQ